MDDCLKIMESSNSRDIFHTQYSERVKYTHLFQKNKAMPLEILTAWPKCNLCPISAVRHECDIS